MPNASEKLLDQVIAHQVDLDKVSNAMRVKIIRQLQQLQQDLVGLIVGVDPTGVEALTFRQRRQLALLTQANETINKAYGRIAGTHGGDMYDLARLETAFTKNSIDSAIGIPLNTTALTQTQLSAVVSNTLIEGAPSRQWWAGQSRNLKDKFTRQMRMGILQGEGVAQLVRRVRGTRAGQFKDGIMNASRREAASLVRSSVQAVTNEAREATYRENAEVVKGYSWVSTLDSRVTDICVARGGKPYDLDYEPIGHNVPWLAGPGRIHWQCRSTSTGILKSWDELKGPNAVTTDAGGKASIETVFNKRLEARGLTRAQIKRTKFRARASMDGQVPADITMGDWLKKKGAKFQDNLLGAGRAKLWRQGKITLEDLVDDKGQSMSLQAIMNKHGIRPTPRRRPKKKPKPPPTGAAPPPATTPAPAAAADTLEAQLGIPAYPAEGFMSVKEAEAYANTHLLDPLGTGKNKYPEWMATWQTYTGHTVKHFGKANYRHLTIDAANEMNVALMQMHVQSDTLGLPRLRGVYTNKRLTRRAASMGDGLLELNPDSINRLVAQKVRLRSLEDFVERRGDDLRQWIASKEAHVQKYQDLRKSMGKQMWINLEIDRASKQMAELRAELALIESGETAAIQKAMADFSKAESSWVQPRYRAGIPAGSRPFGTYGYLTQDLHFDRLMWHEYAHQIHQHLDADYTLRAAHVYRGRDFGAYSKPWEGPKLRPLHDDIEVRQNNISPSEYGDKNPKEWFAENFSLWIHEGDHHPALSAGFVDVLKDMGIHDKVKFGVQLRR